MIENFRNIFAIEELRKRLFFTFALLAVYRVGCVIPTPGIDPEALLDIMQQAQGTMFGFLNVFTGGSLERAAVFALGIMPYITASIILQLLTVVVPYSSRSWLEGRRAGRKKITQQYTATGRSCCRLSSRLRLGLLENATSPGGMRPGAGRRLGFKLMTMLTLTTGTMPSSCGSASRSRSAASATASRSSSSPALSSVCRRRSPRPSSRCRPATSTRSAIAVLTIFMLLVTAFIVFMERSQRRIPVQYAKRVVGRKVYGGQNTYLPLRVNTGGVIPVIFAIVDRGHSVDPGEPLMIRTSTRGFRSSPRRSASGNRSTTCSSSARSSSSRYFYVSIIFNPQDTAENMKKYGGFIPGYPLGPEDVGVHRPHPDPADSDRCGLSCRRLDPAGAPAFRLQGPRACPSSAPPLIGSCPGVGLPPAWGSTSTSAAPRS